MIILVYVDDCILLPKDELPMKRFVQSLKDGDKNFDFTEDGTLENYLGVNIAKFPDGKGFEMSQPFLIDRISRPLILIQRQPRVPETIFLLIFPYWTRMWTVQLEKCAGNTVGLLAWLATCKEPAAEI